MKTECLTNKQVHNLAERFDRAFRRLAQIQKALSWRSGTYGEEPGRITKYGNKIAQLLEDGPTLLSPYPELTSRKFRILDIADFMLICIQEPGTSAAENLKSAGFTEGDIDAVKKRCKNLAQQIRRLNRVHPGPIYYGQKVWHSGQVIECAEYLPLFLDLYSFFLERIPYGDRTYTFRSFHKQFLRAFFLAYIKEAGGSVETLSALLDLMKTARDSVYPQDSRLDGCSDLEPTSLSSEALDKAITRFWKRYPKEAKLMPYQVKQFLCFPLRKVRLPFSMLVENLPYLESQEGEPNVCSAHLESATSESKSTDEASIVEQEPAGGGSSS